MVRLQTSILVREVFLSDTSDKEAMVGKQVLSQSDCCTQQRLQSYRFGSFQDAIRMMYVQKSSLELIAHANFISVKKESMVDRIDQHICFYILVLG
jgi:hypothetical protein